MTKTVEDRLSDMTEIFGEMERPRVADAHLFVLSDVFIDRARRHAENIIDQGDDMLLEEDRASGMNYLHCAGSEEAVNKMRVFVAKLTAH